MAVRSFSETVGGSEHAPTRGMVLPFEPLSLAFNHVNYYVDMPAVSDSLRKFHSLVFRTIFLLVKVTK